ncbi:hypothetical protein DFP73DRAFT_522043 [Morchella snyderi]|nr:hypothetical protein DFP73DRAFT_522043 [Morchella snyderi]
MSTVSPSLAEALEVSTLISSHSNVLKLTWSQRGCTPEEFYNNLLLPLPPNSTSTECSNQIELIGGQITMDAWLKEAHTVGLLEAVFLYCRWRAIKVCSQTSCKDLSTSLSACMPSCSTWPGFRGWILVLAGCMCSYLQFGGGEDADPPWMVVGELDYLFNSLLHKKSPYGENQRWLESVNLIEVFDLMEWISQLHGNSRDPRIIPPPREYLDLNNTRTLEAMSRAKAAGMCPRRIWGILANMPRGHLNLPNFIPQDAGRLVSPHLGHEDCTVDFCQESVMSFTNVKQLHVCTFGREGRPTCNLTPDPIPPFPEHLLNEAALSGIPTAWNFDGTSIVKPGQPYMAISHVWADGTGNGRDEFNRCLYGRFCRIAESLGCIGIWWDTICLPKGKEARGAAINNMQLYYQNAKITLLHDLYIQRYHWVESNERKEEGACFAILMSSWWTRGWTALELLVSRRVMVLFADLVIKDLDGDILAAPGFPGSSCRLLATSAIRHLRKTVKYIDNILLILGPRYVSMPRDKGIIASILLGVEVPIHASRQQLYHGILEEIRILSADNLFHGKETMEHPSFSWCPVDMLDMPATRTPDSSGHLRMRRWEENQWALMGMWDVCSIDYLIKRAIILWKAVPPLVEARLREALSKEHINEHILLCEWIQQYPRALVVKPMICPREQYDVIGVQWVGSIDFEWKYENDGWSPNEPEDVITERRLGRYMAVFGKFSGMDEIGPGMAAYDYLRGLRPVGTPGGNGRDELTTYERVAEGPKAWWQV